MHHMLAFLPKSSQSQQDCRPRTLFLIFLLIVPDVTAFQNSPTTIKASSLQSTQPQCGNNAQQPSQYLGSFPRARNIRFDEVTRVELYKSPANRYHFTIEQPSPMSITFSSCPHAYHRKLFFNQTILVTSNNSTSTSINVPCAAIGRYDLLLTSSPRKKNTPCSLDVRVSRFNIHSNWSLLDRIETSQIRHYNRLQRKQMILKWDRSKLDIYAMHYCLVIGTARNHPSLCAAIQSTAEYNDRMFCALGGVHNGLRSASKPINITRSGVTITCTGKKNHQILQNLTPHTKYFVDVFGVHTMLDNLAFRLGSTTVWFNRSLPIVLQDDGLVTTKLSDLGRQTVFSFKVPKRPNSNTTSVLILPCGNTLSVKVFKRKTLQANEQVYKPTPIRIGHSSKGDRFVIKVAPAFESESRRTLRIGIIASTSPRYTVLPELPNNTSVEEITSRSSCQSTWIVWHSSPDVRHIMYCILVVKVTSESTFNDDYTSSNVCEIDMQIMQQPSMHQMHCFLPDRSRVPIQRYQLTQLTPGSLYSVHVMVNFENTSLPYELLRISTNPNCYSITEDTRRLVEPPNETDVTKQIDKSH